MLIGAYHIIILAVAVWAILSGYPKGLYRQLGSVLAVAFGIVAVRMTAPMCIQYIDGIVPGFFDGFNRRFIIETLTCGVIYLFVVGIIWLVTIPLGTVMRVLGSGVVNSIGGAVFKLFRYLMLLSLAFNFLVDISPDSDLTRASGMHDGNLVEGVIKLAPAVLGFPDGEEVSHRQQLEDAKKIS